MTPPANKVAGSVGERGETLQPKKNAAPNLFTTERKKIPHKKVARARSGGFPATGTTHLGFKN